MIVEIEDQRPLRELTKPTSELLIRFQVERWRQKFTGSYSTKGFVLVSKVL